MREGGGEGKTGGGESVRECSMGGYALRMKAHS